MSLKEFANKAKHMVVDEDEEVKAPVKPKNPLQTSNPTYSFPTIMPTPSSGTLGSPFAVPSAVVVDENVYKQLLSKTNFDTTDVGKIVHRYFDALEDSGLDTNTRFKSAMSQASKLDGITPDRILSAFDDLKSMLQREMKNFADSAKSNEDKEITTRQNRLQEIADQITRLEQERTQVTNELGSAQNDHSNTVQQFTLAANRRSTEIDQQKAQFSTMLQH